MRIVFNRNSYLAKTRLFAKRSSVTKKNTSTKTNSSNRISLLNSLIGKSKYVNKYEKAKTITTTKLQDYTDMKKAADSLQEHINKLLETGDNSLFSKAASNQKESNNNSTDKSTEKNTSKDKQKETELAANKKKVVEEINSFIEDYNTMVSKMNRIGGTINNLYANHLKKYVEQERLELKELGITQSSNGTLSVNQKTLKSADIKKLQKVFGTKEGFVDKVAERSKSVEVHAESNITTLKKRNYISSSNYNRYGSSYDNYVNSGSRYHSKG